jgi:CDP-diacylglycerol--glycerol-3-phosphate 3-phosphatidyltransferase
MTETRIPGTSAAQARRQRKAAKVRGGPFGLIPVNPVRPKVSGGDSGKDSAGGNKSRDHNPRDHNPSSNASSRLRTGLYGLKPWFADRLGVVRRFLVRHSISPNTISFCGIGFGAAAGLSLATMSVGAVRGVVVAALLVARLACANLDGAVARESGRVGRFGAVVNELGDRCAELFALAGLAGCITIVGTREWLLASAALACSAPSWVSLAGAAAGAPRVQGGPVGKTERCLLLVVIAAFGHVVPLLFVLAIGSALTAVVRAVRIRSLLMAPSEGTAS